MSAELPAIALPDPDYEVVWPTSRQQPDVINSILLSLDQSLGITVPLRLRDPDTKTTRLVEVTDLEFEFDQLRVNFVLSGNLVGGGRVNGRVYIKPQNDDVAGHVRISL